MPRITFKTIRKIFLILLVAGLIFSTGYYLGYIGLKAQLKQFPKVTITRQVPPDKSHLDFSLFWRVWDTLETRYFDQSKLKPSEMVYGAISGMVDSIGDPYTVFLPPSENKVVQEDLNGFFEGVGIQMGYRGNQLTVISPLPGSPAEKAGIKAGDAIIGIKDESKNIDRGTVGITMPEAVQAIRGKAGTKVTLLVTRDQVSDPILIDIIRAKLDVPTLTISYVGDSQNIVHIKLIKFGGETDKEWQEAVREILKKGQAKGIILDLRNNPGGYLMEAVNIASEFVKTGSVVVIEERSDNLREEFKTERLGLLVNSPVVILVNKGSASSSEILAGALRELDTAKLVGEVTFGKGTIQEPQQLEGGAGLHITVGRWLTPSGVWVNEKGLEPDVKIEDNPDTDEDEQLLEAIKILSS